MLTVNDRLAGAFVWADGSAPNFTAWAAGQPNNDGPGFGEDCAHTFASAGDGRWNDMECVGGGRVMPGLCAARRCNGTSC